MPAPGPFLCQKYSSALCSLICSRKVFRLKDQGKGFTRLEHIHKQSLKCFRYFTCWSFQSIELLGERILFKV